jgi:hypothetical protein
MLLHSLALPDSRGSTRLPLLSHRETPSLQPLGGTLEQCPLLDVPRMRTERDVRYPQKPVLLDGCDFKTLKVLLLHFQEHSCQSLPQR